MQPPQLNRRDAMTTTNEQLIDASIAAAANKATFGGASATVFSWLLSSEFGMLAGIVIGVVGLLVNWYYRDKQDRRDEREHLRRMRSMETRPHDADVH